MYMLYLSRLSTAPIQTKHGAHFKCIHCTYRKIEGHDYRLRDPEGVMILSKTLLLQGLHDIEFVDNVY